MNLPTFAKAIVAALVAGLAPVGTAAATGPVTTASVVASLIAALVGFGATYTVPNRGAAGGLVVTLKTDASKFLAVIAAGLPALVEAAARAALAPEPTPVPVSVSNVYNVAGPAPVVEPPVVPPV